MKEIILTRGAVAIVDDEDYHKLLRYKWHKSTLGYAVANSKTARGQRTILYMHRVVMRTPKNKMCDHRDRNKLNNQKHNLRTCNKSQNMCNSVKILSNNRSGFRGVSHQYGKWQASIGVKGTLIYIGIYADKTEAAKAYNKAAKKYHGRFANLNTIP